MSKPTTRDLLVARQKELEAAIAAIESKSATLRKQRDELQAKLAPIEVQIRDLNQKIKAAEQPGLSDAKLELAAVARALQSKSMRVEAGALKAEG